MFWSFCRFFGRWLDERRLRQRLLLRFRDGRRWRYLDPFRAWREIQNHPTVNFQDVMGFVDAGHKAETDACIDALCEVFGVEKWNDETRTGLTDSEILDLFRYLIDYLDRLKKNTSPGPISPSPTGSESSNSEALPDAASNACSDSGSTSDDPSCGTAAESSPASEQP